MKIFLILSGSLAAGALATIVLLVMGETPVNALTMGCYVLGAVACLVYANSLFRRNCPKCQSKIKAGSLQCPNCKCDLQQKPDGQQPNKP